MYILPVDSTQQNSISEVKLIDTVDNHSAKKRAKTLFVSEGYAVIQSSYHKAIVGNLKLPKTSLIFETRVLHINKRNLSGKEFKWKN